MWENLITSVGTFIAGGAFTTLLFIRLNKREKIAEVEEKEIAVDEKELDFSEKEAKVNAERAERAWKRVATVEERIEELIKELDSIQAELIRVKIELAKEKESKVEVEGKHALLKKKIELECTCMKGKIDLNEW